MELVDSTLGLYVELRAEPSSAARLPVVVVDDPVAVAAAAAPPGALLPPPAPVETPVTVKFPALEVEAPA